MGINYSIDVAGRTVRLEYVGETDLDELTATMRAIFRSPSYEPGFGFLVDRRHEKPATIPHLEQVVSFSILNKARLVGARWALVFASVASFGMALAENAILPMPDQVQVFDDVDSAEGWLRETAPKK